MTRTSLTVDATVLTTGAVVAADLNVVIELGYLLSKSSRFLTCSQILDSIGDGMCCDYGDGPPRLLDDSQLLCVRQ
jgi:hypothetical protein